MHSSTSVPKLVVNGEGVSAGVQVAVPDASAVESPPMRLLLAAALLLVTFQQGRAEPERHLIPDGYVGWVAIAFGAANGEAPMYEGDARLYRIPRIG
jgi:hypothetical protein